MACPECSRVGYAHCLHEPTRGPKPPGALEASVPQLREEIRLLGVDLERRGGVLRRLVDEITTYLASLDLEVEDLPIESPLRHAIEDARTELK